MYHKSTAYSAPTLRAADILLTTTTITGKIVSSPFTSLPFFLFLFSRSLLDAAVVLICSSLSLSLLNGIDYRRTELNGPSTQHRKLTPTVYICVFTCKKLFLHEAQVWFPVCSLSLPPETIKLLLKKIRRSPKSWTYSTVVHAQRGVAVNRRQKPHAKPAVPKTALFVPTTAQFVPTHERKHA